MSGLWQIVASNALIAVLMALGVTLVGRFWKNPQGQHLLWVLVLAKLLAPPIVTTSVVFPVGQSSISETSPALDSRGGSHPAGVSIVDGDQNLIAPIDARPLAAGEAPAPPESGPSVTAWLDELPWLDLAAGLWAAGSLALALYYSAGIFWFQRLLRSAQPAPPMVEQMGALIGRQLGLRRSPQIVMFRARVSPLVWPLGSGPRIMLPLELCERLSLDALRTILVHEMAHLRRRDHLVRLLELVATTLFWWHPVVWWASRRLRDLEEECCDGIVLGAIPKGGKAYATAILDTLDFIAERPATGALGLTMVRRSSSLAKRIRMLQAPAPSRQLRLRHLCSIAALMALPLGFAFAAAADPSGDAAENGEKPASAAVGSLATALEAEETRHETVTAALSFLANAVEAEETGDKITFKDPTGDDDGPGTYTYPTDPVYTPGSFDLTAFSVTKKQDRLKFDVTVAAPLADPWKMRAGFSVQMVFIFIRTDDRQAASFTDSVPGLNVTFAAGDGWNKLVILSPQPASRIEDEIERKVPAAQRSSIIVPDRAKGAGSTISATVDLAQLGGGDPTKWSYQVVMQSNEGYPDKSDLLTRKVNEIEAPHRFGGGTNSDCDPHVIDILAGKGQGAAEEAREQYQMLDYECNPDGTAKQAAVLKMVHK